jgi:hypothetical protein
MRYNFVLFPTLLFPNILGGTLGSGVGFLFFKILACSWCGGCYVEYFVAYFLVRYVADVLFLSCILT